MVHNRRYLIVLSETDLRDKKPSHRRSVWKKEWGSGEKRKGTHLCDSIEPSKPIFHKKVFRFDRGQGKGKPGEKSCPEQLKKSRVRK